MNKLFKISGTMAFGSKLNATMHIFAVDSADALSGAENRGYVFEADTVAVQEIEAKGVPYLRVNEFVGKFYAKAFDDQRFGQAFLNEFSKDYPAVDAHRYGGYLWEEKYINVALDKIHGLKLIDFSVKD